MSQAHHKTKIMKTTLLSLLIAISFALNAQDASRSTLKKINDNDLHFLAGNAISAGVGYSMHFLTDRPVLSCLAGFVTGTAVGIGKEFIYDRAMHRGTFSTGDMATTAWGALVGSLSLRIVIDIEKRHDKKHFLFRPANKAKEDNFKELYVYNN